jgi:hypothetical protein
MRCLHWSTATAVLAAIAPVAAVLCKQSSFSYLGCTLVQQSMLDRIWHITFGLRVECVICSRQRESSDFITDKHRVQNVYGNSSSSSVFACTKEWCYFKMLKAVSMCAASAHTPLVYAVYFCVPSCSSSSSSQQPQRDARSG